MKIRRWLLMLGSIGIVNATSADLDDPLTEELPIVLSASRLKQPTREAPLPVTVIDRELIDSFPAQSIAEVMRLVPGYIVGVINNRATMVTNHGLGGEQARNFQVLIDGRSIYSGILGGVDWENLEIDLEDIERIEAVRAPNAVSYGANAFLGVVNIITRHTSQTTGNRTDGTVGGPDRYRRLFASHGGVEDDLGYRISLSWRDIEGRSGVNDGHRPFNINGRVDYRISSADTLELQLGYGKQEIEDGRAGNPIDPFRTRDAERHYQLLRWHRTWNTDDEMIMTAYHNYFKLRDTFLAGPIPPFPASPLNLGYEYHRYDLEAVGYKRLSDNLRSVFGGELRHDRGRSPTFVYPGDWGKNDLKRAFARGEWRSGGQNLLINAGVIYEDATIGGGNLSPMASINYLFGDSGSLRGSYSEAYRYPVLFEEKANALIYGVIPFILTTGDLDPVKIRSYDIGLRNRYGKLRYELRLFREEIDDLIMVQEMGDVNLFRNSDWAEIKGIEVQLDSRIDWLDSRLTANYAYTQIDSDDIDAKVSESAPRHNGSVFLMHRLPGDWTLSESFTYMSSVTHLSWDPVPVVRRLDARLKKTWRMGDTGSLSLSLAALNLLEQDAYLQPVEERGREYRAEIAMEF